MSLQSKNCEVSWWNDSSSNCWTEKNTGKQYVLQTRQLRRSVIVDLGASVSESKIATANIYENIEY